MDRTEVSFSLLLPLPYPNAQKFENVRPLNTETKTSIESEETSKKLCIPTKMATASLVPTSKIFPASPKSPASIRARTSVIVASSQQQQQRRRELLLKSAVAIPAILNLKEAPISEAREVEVGSYLPPSASDPSFVLFKAKPSDTPALRAGDA